MAAGYGHHVQARRTTNWSPIAASHRPCPPFVEPTSSTAASKCRPRSTGLPSRSISVSWRWPSASQAPALLIPMAIFALFIVAGFGVAGAMDAPRTGPWQASADAARCADAPWDRDACRAARRTRRGDADADPAGADLRMGDGGSDDRRAGRVIRRRCQERGVDQFDPALAGARDRSLRARAQ